MTINGCYLTSETDEVNEMLISTGFAAIAAGFSSGKNFGRSSNWFVKIQTELDQLFRRFVELESQFEFSKSHA